MLEGSEAKWDSHQFSFCWFNSLPRVLLCHTSPYQLDYHVSYIEILDLCLRNNCKISTFMTFFPGSWKNKKKLVPNLCPYKNNSFVNYCLDGVSIDGKCYYYKQIFVFGISFFSFLCANTDSRSSHEWHWSVQVYPKFVISVKVNRFHAFLQNNS